MDHLVDTLSVANDAWAGRSEEAFPDIDALARAFGRRAPAWIRALMWIRDGFAGFMGLKRSTDAPLNGPNDPLAVGRFIGFFRIVARDENEIVAGEDDRHLDFRVSFLRRRDDAGTFVTVSTVVRFNSALGRAYFALVGPFHRRVVPAMMRAASRGEARLARSTRWAPTRGAAAAPSSHRARRGPERLRSARRIGP